jgi:hypothetical protein
VKADKTASRKGKQDQQDLGNDVLAVAFHRSSGKIALDVASTIMVRERCEAQRKSLRKGEDAMLMVFHNPQNGYEEEVTCPGLWTFLFGPLYFAMRGVWTHAVLSFVLAIVTWGLSWLVYPFAARDLMRTHYLRKGWREGPNPESKSDEPTSPPPVVDRPTPPPGRKMIYTLDHPEGFEVDDLAPPA